jgi:hypothetical protein
MMGSFNPRVLPSQSTLLWHCPTNTGVTTQSNFLTLEFLLGSILQMCVVKVETGKEEEEEEGPMVAKAQFTE